MSELESVIRRLEELDHRVTPSRVAVIAAVLSYSGHFTVDDVVRRARGVGRATVFRTMRLLLEVDVVCRVLLEDGSLHYRVSRRGHHHHLVCVSCGNVQDLDDCAVGDLVRELAAATEYEIEGHWLEFYGRCVTCRSPVAVAARK
ncbi:MAG: Fur family transcriptional regulator [Dehalococcoidia bacterium]|nr:Fur family transcriptional regulator [Dehalococcoidia bacterium]